MTRQKRQAYTLIELLAVILIIGVLTGIAFPQYVRSRERTIDKQAIAYLRAIQAAQKSYKLDTGKYFPYSPGTIYGFSAINDGLDLDLVDEDTWDEISITSQYPDGYMVSIMRDRGGYDRLWYIGSGFPNPICSNDCP